IGDPDGYYYRRVYVDAARAVSVAAGHPLVDADRVAVVGTSQGGGIAIAAAALSGAAAAVVANLPFCCHFDRAVRITDAGACAAATPSGRWRRCRISTPSTSRAGRTRPRRSPSR